MPKNPVPLNYGPPPLSPKDPLLTKVLLIVDLLLLLSGCALSCGAGFAFDAPDSDRHFTTWVFVVTSLALPVTCILAIWVGASLTKTRNHKAAQLILLLPLADVLIFAINLGWMQFSRGGRF
jgi:hypothetical protein